MTPPREFFEKYVLRAYDEFRGKPDDEYLAKTAVHHANVMAERMWYHFASCDPSRIFSAQDAADYRRAIEKHQCPDFGIVRDIDDGFKHVELRRNSRRRVTSAAQTAAARVHWTNNAGQELTWENGSGEPLVWEGPVIVRLDDGSERLLEPILEDVVRMWDRLSA